MQGMMQDDAGLITTPTVLAGAPQLQNGPVSFGIPDLCVGAGLGMCPLLFASVSIVVCVSSVHKNHNTRALTAVFAFQTVSHPL